MNPYVTGSCHFYVPSSTGTQSIFESNSHDSSQSENYQLDYTHYVQKIKPNLLIYKYLAICLESSNRPHDLIVTSRKFLPLRVYFMLTFSILIALIPLPTSHSVSFLTSQGATHCDSIQIQEGSYYQGSKADRIHLWIEFYEKNSDMY